MLTTFIGVSQATWSAWAPWAEVAVTLVVGSGALWLANRQLGHLRQDARDSQDSSRVQLDAIRQQVDIATQAISHAQRAHTEQLAAMEANRKAMFRPVVFAHEASLRPGSTGARCRPAVRVTNVGAGPATSVEVEVWTGLAGEPAGSFDALESLAKRSRESLQSPS